MLLLIAILHKATQVSDPQAAMDKGVAVANAASDVRSVAQLATSVSNLCIYLGIVMPHWQLLGAFAVYVLQLSAWCHLHMRTCMQASDMTEALCTE